MALTETEKLAQIETSCGRPPPPKMALFEPKSLALTDRNHWHKSNRISQNVSTGDNIQLLANLDDVDNSINSFEWSVDSAIINTRPTSEIGFIHVPLDYDKDSLKVFLTITSKKLQIKDSITIYLTKHE